MVNFKLGEAWAIAELQFRLCSVSDYEEFESDYLGVMGLQVKDCHFWEILCKNFII